MSKDNVQMTYLLEVAETTAKHQDLMLRQFLRNVPQWFYRLPPHQIAKILHDEAEELTAIYPTDQMQAVEEKPY